MLLGLISDLLQRHQNLYHTVSLLRVVPLPSRPPLPAFGRDRYPSLRIREWRMPRAKSPRWIGPFSALTLPR
jgi:hypothetical protein